MSGDSALSFERQLWPVQAGDLSQYALGYFRRDSQVKFNPNHWMVPGVSPKEDVAYPSAQAAGREEASCPGLMWFWDC